MRPHSHSGVRPPLTIPARKLAGFAAAALCAPGKAFLASQQAGGGQDQICAGYRVGPRWGKVVVAEINLRVRSKADGEEMTARIPGRKARNPGVTVAVDGGLCADGEAAHTLDGKIYFPFLEPRTKMWVRLLKTLK